MTLITRLAFLLALSPTIGLAQAPKVIWSQPAHSGPINDVAFSPDGKLLVTASDDQLVKLWRTRDGASLATLATHYDVATSVAFSPDGSLLATGGIDRQVNVIRMSDLHPLYATSDTGFVRGLAFSHDGFLLSSALGYSSNERHEYRASDGELFSITHDHWGTVWSVAYSKDGRYLASSGADGRVIVYSAQNGQYLFDVGQHEGDVIAVEFSPSSRLLASAGEYDRRLVLSDLGSGGSSRTINVGKMSLHGISFSPDGRFIAAAGEDWPTNGRINLYEVTSGQRVAGYSQETGSNVGSIAYASKGHAFAYGTREGTLVLAAAPPVVPAQR